jgi:hypothetical protein
MITDNQFFKPVIIITSLLVCVFVGFNNQNNPIFTNNEVMEYVPKGPAKCFRQICFDINEKKEYPDSTFNTFFSEHNPVKYAEFCEKINLDAVLLLSVTQSGYATYRQTKINTVYPGMKGDFFGETLKELHKRGISGFGYVGIGWILKYAKEHPEYTDGNKTNPLICLNSPYRNEVMESSREILSNYPVDGLRFDILDQPAECRCDGCKKLYYEMFTGTMPNKWIDWKHQQKFRLESISRIVKDLYTVCKAIKPSVPIWQNWFNGEQYADISDLRYVDMAYLEFADPFRELFLNGVFNKEGIITGKVIENTNTRWKCLVLGGKCYSYFASVGKTGLPDLDTSFDRDVPSNWFEKSLTPFYAQVREVEPYLENTNPITNIAIVYNEKTRFHYDQYSREDYMKVLRDITEPLLSSGNPVRFISNINIVTTPLEGYKALLLPESSGFTEDQLAVIKNYAEQGGIVVIIGDALSYTAEGSPLDNFSGSEMMGISRKEKSQELKKTGNIESYSKNQANPREIIRDGKMPAKVYTIDKQCTRIAVRTGQTLSFIKTPKEQIKPLVHVNQYGKGFVYYIASAEMPEVMAAVLNHARVLSPIKNDNLSGLAVLTKKNDKDEWMLHLLGKGKYSLIIDKEYCPATNISSTYLVDIKNIKIKNNKNRIMIDVDNENDYDVIILN